MTERDGENVFRLWRQDAGLTQMQVAIGLSIHVSTVNGWESGRAAPRRRQWPQIAELFGKTVAEVAAACIALGDDDAAAVPAKSKS